MFVARLRQGVPQEGRGDLHLREVRSLDSEKRLDELREEVTAGTVQGYVAASVRSNRPMSAIVLHPFQVRLAMKLEKVKDSGAVTFYAVSKNNFCPILSGFN